MSHYENHLFRSELPIIFHHDHVSPKGCLSNWHENIELLYCSAGKGKAIINSTPVEMKPGSLILINSGDIHYTVPDTEALEYYCQIKHRYAQAVEEYERTCAPLTIDRVNSDNYWMWVKTPWPWEGGCLCGTMKNDCSTR